MSVISDNSARVESETFLKLLIISRKFIRRKILFEIWHCKVNIFAAWCPYGCLESFHCLLTKTPHPCSADASGVAFDVVSEILFQSDLPDECLFSFLRAVGVGCALYEETVAGILDY